MPKHFFNSNRQSDNWSDDSLMRTRPYVTVVLAMSADGKIADSQRSAARFPSAADKAHLEQQVARADATLFGAGTLRAYGTTLPVANPALIEARRQRQQPEQPIQIVCSATGSLNPQWRFFQQPIPRWLITTPKGEALWQTLCDGQVSAAKGELQRLFERKLVVPFPMDWGGLMRSLKSPAATDDRSPIDYLTVMGGGELVASLLADSLVDELYLTICPLLIGGDRAPTPVGGLGFTLPNTPTLTLQSVRAEGDEVFLHYRVRPVND